MPSSVEVPRNQESATPYGEDMPHWPLYSTILPPACLLIMSRMKPGPAPSHSIRATEDCGVELEGVGAMDDDGLNESAGT